jgi:type I restriction enzyme S subunit
MSGVPLACAIFWTLSIVAIPEELDKLRLVAGDLLIVEGNGSVTDIGRSAIWRGEIEDCVHQNHIIRVRFFGGLSPEYMEAFINSPLGQNYMRKVASSTSGLHTLSVAKVRSITIPLPPVTEQAAIVEAVNEKLSQIDALEAEVERGLRRAGRLRQAILKAAFEGKLVPQDPNDEPASVLLERIRKEAAAADTRQAGKRRQKTIKRRQKSKASRKKTTV